MKYLTSYQLFVKRKEDVEQPPNYSINCIPVLTLGSNYSNYCVTFYAEDGVNVFRIGDYDEYEFKGIYCVFYRIGQTV